MNLSVLMRHLESSTGGSVNLRTYHPAFLNSESLLLTADQYIHHGPGCRFMKMNRTFRICSEQKNRTIEKAGLNQPFAGTCPFGIWELVTPVFFDGSLACVLYAGHFIPVSTPPETLAPELRKLPVLTPEREAEIREKSAFIAEFIKIEIQLCVESGALLGKKRNENFYAANTRRFIDCNFTRNVSMSDLAESLHVNPGYLGEILKKVHGKSFRQMLTERRIREAEVFLKLHHDLSISQIAALCGFEDSNYFSLVFHKAMGISPTAYKTAHRN